MSALNGSVEQEDYQLSPLNVVVIQWTHLQLISFAIAPVVLLIVHLLKRRSGGAIANESTVNRILELGGLSSPLECPEQDIVRRTKY